MQATWTWTPQFESQGTTASAEDASTRTGAASVIANTFTAIKNVEISDVTATKKHPAAFAVLAQSPVIVVLLQLWQWITARLKQTAPMATRSSMKTLSHLALGGRKTITLVEVDGVRYLVGGGADTVTTIVAVSNETHEINHDSSLPMREDA